MRRLFGLSAAAAVVIGLSASHLVWSAPPPGRKVLICHASGDGGGKIIEVSVNALPAHTRHGDCVIALSTPANRELKGEECALTRVTPPDPLPDDFDPTLCAPVP